VATIDFPADPGAHWRLCRLHGVTVVTATHDHKMLTTNTIAWHHIKSAVPADWEATAYSVEERLGRFEFSDRSGVRGLFSWDPCRRETMILSFLRSRETGVSDTLPSDLKTRMVGEFKLGFARAGSPCQAIWYLAAFYEKFLRSQGAIVTKLQEGLTWHGMPAVQALYHARGEHQMDRFMGRL
jgi:hypothetical protein